MLDYKKFTQPPQAVGYSLINKRFSQPLLIEYGNWNQSVFHAHIHLIPSEINQYNIKNMIKKMWNSNQIKFQKINLKELKKIFQQDREYVSIEENNQLYIFRTKKSSIPNNQLYKILSYRQNFIKNKEFQIISSWSKMSENEKFIDEQKRKITKKLLKDF